MKIDEQTRQEAAQWFAAIRRGPMSLDEREAFDSWRVDPLNQAALNSMHEVWGEVAGIGQYVEVPRRRPFPRRAAIAAGVAALVASASLFFVMQPSGPPPHEQLATAVGEQRTTTMPDGSVVSMNVVTRLSYDFGDTRRAVALGEGEAAFFVRKDRTKPFVVTAGDYEIEAVGTAFNVRNRGGEVDVSVIEGIVSVRAIRGPRAGQEITRLAAGKRIELGPRPNAAAAGDIAAIAPQSAAEWRMRTLTYEDAPVSRIVDDLNLYFDRPVEIAELGLADRRITLRLQVEDRERALSTLAGLLEVQVQRGAKVDRLSE